MKSVNSKDKNGKTALHRSVIAANINEVNKLLKNSKINVNAQDIYGDTAIHYTQRLGPADFTASENITEALLKHDKINPNVQNDLMLAPLHNALVFGNIERVNALLNHHKINPNIQNNIGNSPFHDACMYSNSFSKIKIKVRALLCHPLFDINMKNFDGQTALDIARRSGFFEEIEILINEKNKHERELLYDYCKSMIQPNIPITKSTRKRKAKELRRDKLRLHPEIIQMISSYLKWTDISKKPYYTVEESIKR